ncbi:RCC1 and BTB domain-containing protein 1-like [Dermatophagoides farinae]|uniref:RCC1 and BTB domain-containing protein 1-like n=1 Tax=Dermatophagoides farinae TaxID=6954 RepID=UPI003F5DF49F
MLMVIVETYYTYLRMLHTGKIHINRQNIAELIDLANCYGDERSPTDNIDIELFQDNLEYIDQEFLQSIAQIFSFTYEDEKQFLLMIKMIACGQYHSLMLQQDGHVFAMGDNCCDKITGNETSSYESMINTGIENVKLIACGQFHSIVVTNSSEIYSWGDNFFGQLGLGDQNDRNTPCLVTFPNDDSVDTRIKDIVAGSKHSLFLLENGQLWGCGSNYDGELGLGYDIGPTKLTKLPFENVQQIACSKDHNLSLAHDGLNYYAWGKTMNGTWSSPRKLYDQHSSFASASALLLESQTTFGLTSVTNLFESNYTSTIQSNCQLFNNPNYYDVEFIIEKKPIKVSKCYLKSVSKFYGDKFSNDWEEEKKVTISDYSYDAYYEYLRMLHTGEININHQNNRIYFYGLFS